MIPNSRSKCIFVVFRYWKEEKKNFVNLIEKNRNLDHSYILDFKKLEIKKSNLEAKIAVTELKFFKLSTKSFVKKDLESIISFSGKKTLPLYFVESYSVQ
jgi:hypothetical protein